MEEDQDEQNPVFENTQPIKKNISYFPFKERLWMSISILFPCSLLLSIGLYCISLTSQKDWLQVAGGYLQMEQQLIAILLISLISAAFFVLLKMNPDLQISNPLIYLPALFVIGILFLIGIRLPFSAPLYFAGRISSDILVIVMKHQAKPANMFFFQIWPTKLLILQMLLVLLRVDGYLNTPWWILLFECPVIIAISIFGIVVMIRQMIHCIQNRQHRAYQRKEMFAFANLILLLIYASLFSFNIFNWAALGFQTSCTYEIGIGFSLSYFLFCLLFWKQITYALVSQPFKIFYRIAQNSFSDKFYKNVDCGTNWSVELCNKCNQRPADVLFSKCCHLYICSQCLLCQRHCLICKDYTQQVRAQRVIWNNHEEDEIFRFKFYRENEFKAVHLS